jgi:hypothetical protein
MTATTYTHEQVAPWIAELNSRSRWAEGYSCNVIQRFIDIDVEIKDILISLAVSGLKHLQLEAYHSGLQNAQANASYTMELVLKAFASEINFPAVNYIIEDVKQVWYRERFHVADPGQPARVMMLCKLLDVAVIYLNKQCELDENQAAAVSMIARYSKDSQEIGIQELVDEFKQTV